MQSIRFIPAVRLFLCLVFFALVAIAAPSADAAPRVAYACTEVGLDSALAAGGTAIFSCVGATTITVSATKFISVSGTALDGGGLLTLSGGGVRAVFDVNAGVNATLSNLTIANGICGICNGGGIYNDGTLTVTNSTFSGNSPFSGGGIYNATGATLTVTNSTFSSNSAASGSGGGIYSNGTLTVTNSTFSNNNASVEGGGIFNDSGGTVNVTNSTFSGNNPSTNGYGGGIYNHSGGTLTVTNSTFSGNNGYFGGGIFNDNGTATVTNSTFSGNTAHTYGGGIHNPGGTLTVTNSTLSGNSASIKGGGIFNDIYGTATVTNSTFSGNTATTYGGGIFNNGGTATAKNSIIANNTTGGNCGGTITDGGGNLVWGDTTCPGINADPKLGALASNGGPTQTMKLGPDSAAIDAAVTANCPTTDQRGKSRNDLQCDIGAYEMQMTDGNWTQRTIADGPLTTFGPTTAGIGFSSDFPPNPGLTTVAKVTNWTGGTPTNAIGAWWDINPTTSTGLNITLELCYIDSESNSKNLGDLSFWRYSGGVWGLVSAPTSTDRDANGNNCATLDHVTDLSRWTLAGGNPGKPPTAVTLSSFHAAAPLFDLGAWLKEFLGR